MKVQRPVIHASTAMPPTVGGAATSRAAATKKTATTTTATPETTTTTPPPSRWDPAAWSTMQGLASAPTTSTNPTAHLARVAAGLPALPVLDDAAAALASPLLHRAREPLAGLSCAGELQSLLTAGEVRVGATEDASPLGRLVSLDRHLRLRLSPAVLTMPADDPTLQAALVRALAAAKVARAEPAHNGSDAWRGRIEGLVVGDALVRHLGLTGVPPSTPLPTPPRGAIFYPAAGVDTAGIEAARGLFPTVTSAICADLAYGADVVTGSSDATFTTAWRKQDLVKDPVREPASVVWLRAPGDFATLMYVPKFVAACLAPLVTGGACAIDGSWAAKPVLMHLPLDTIGFAPGAPVERRGSIVDTVTKIRPVSSEHLLTALDLDRAVDVLATGPSPFHLADLQDEGSLTGRAVKAKTPEEQLAVLRSVRRTAQALGGQALRDVVDDVLARAVDGRRGRANAFDAAVAAAIGAGPPAPVLDLGDAIAPPIALSPTAPTTATTTATTTAPTLTVADLRAAADRLALTHASPLHAFDAAVSALPAAERVSHADQLAAIRRGLVATTTTGVRALLADGLTDRDGRLRVNANAERGLGAKLDDIVAAGLMSGADVDRALGRLAEEALAQMTPTLAAVGLSSFKPLTDPRDPILKAVIETALDRGVIEQAVVDARMAAAQRA